MKRLAFVVLTALALAGCGEKAATVSGAPDSEDDVELIGVIQSQSARLYVFHDLKARNTCYTSIVWRANNSGIAMSCVPDAKAGAQ